MVKPGLVNLDFADIRAVMSEMGKAMMGTGESTGDRRAIEASEAAISNPLLDDVSLKGARAVLINITGGPDMTLYEVDEAANRIREEVDPEANIIFGSTFSDTMQGKMRVSVVATGIDAGEMKQRPYQPEYAASGARKPLQTPAPVKKPEVASAAAAAAKSERSPSEIVRQAAGTTMSEIARQAVARSTQQTAPAQQAQPIVRIVDEAVAEQEAVAHAYPAAAQAESAMRMAAGARASIGTAAAIEAAPGPLFVSPRAEQPQQPTLFSNQAPSASPQLSRTELEDVAEEDAPNSGGLFSRLRAIAGRTYDGRSRPEVEEEEAPSSMFAAAEPRKAEVRESRPSVAEEEEMYDIPAFLRRQAN
jgi:cell division protein FtsZ